ncbi:MAG: hypothetical protein WCT18_03860 [Patescibacteria group bacterium]
MDIATITPQFVDLALKHKWGEVKELPAEEIQILFEVVAAAGFNPKEIVPANLTGDYRDQGGNKTGEKFLINRFSPFKVVGQENSDHYFATGWLDCALRRVVFGATRQKENREQLIVAMQSEIERSVPLEPIQLTPEGDRLCEYPPRFYELGGLEYFVDHTRDDRNLSLCVGIHKCCGGWMDRHNVTDSHDVVICRSCHLRVLFSKEIKTYGELREALAT